MFKIIATAVLLSLTACSGSSDPIDWEDSYECEPVGRNIACCPEGWTACGETCIEDWENCY